MTVAVPVLTDVTKPDLEMVATSVGLILHETDGLFAVLPSLLVPNTVICTVLPVVPVSMVGVAGPTASEDMVGFTKKPVQLTVKPKVRSAAKVPVRQSLCFVDDMVIEELLGRDPCSLRIVLRRPGSCKNCSRENFGPSA